ncbi:hypothetical protein [Planctomycetes bacterium TBK1r]
MEPRAHLDEQITALNDLGHAAQRAYMATAVLPKMARGGDMVSVAAFLAKLTVVQRKNLDECLDRAEHWLGRTNPVYVPIPAAEGERDSACLGASALLQQLAVLAGIDAEAGEPLPVDEDELARALVAKWQNRTPDWLLSAPVDELQHLADVAKQETYAAIKRLTDQFYTAAFAQRDGIIEASNETGVDDGSLELADRKAEQTTEVSTPTSDDDLPRSTRANQPSRLKARSAYHYAMKRIPDANTMTAPELFDAILNDGEAAQMLPPNADTFRRYLNDCGIRLKKSGPKAAGGSVVRWSDL